MDPFMDAVHGLPLCTTSHFVKLHAEKSALSTEPGMEPGTLGLEGRDLTTAPTPPLLDHLSGPSSWIPSWTRYMDYPCAPLLIL